MFNVKASYDGPFIILTSLNSSSFSSKEGCHIVIKGYDIAKIQVGSRDVF